MEHPHNAALIGGIVTLLVGLSYLVETFSSPAALEPFRLLDWLPWISGQHWWGWLYVVGSVALMFHGITEAPRYLTIGVWRVVSCLFGVFVWGAFGTASGYASLFGPDHLDVGSFGAAASVGMVLCLAVAAKQASMELVPLLHPGHVRHRAEHPRG